MLGRRDVWFSILLLFVATPGTAAAQTFTEFPLPKTAITEVPLNITSGPDGNLWFTLRGFPAIGRITVLGVVTEFSYPSTEAAGSPQDIAAGPDGNLWFTEFELGQIGRITTAGVITLFPAPSGSHPSAIVAGPDGNLWFTDGASVGKVTTAGVVTEFATPSGYDPLGITAGPDGNLWFAEGAGSIGKITTAGVITEYPLPAPSSVPQHIAAGPDGNLWFTEEQGIDIGRITTAGVITEFPSEYIQALGITSRSDGLWFIDGNNYIGIITPSGSITEFPIPTQASNPSGITVGPDGNIWFTELGSKKIGRLVSPKVPAVAPSIMLVANAEGENPTIAPNTWVEIKGSNLAPAGDTRTWRASDFGSGFLPTALDGVSVSFNAEEVPVYFISGSQINVLTPIGLSSPATVRVVNNGVASQVFVPPVQQESPSLFVNNGGPYVLSTHADGSLIGPASLFPGLTSPAIPGETIVLYGNGFGQTSVPVENLSPTQGGTLPVLPFVTIGGMGASVQFAGLISPGLFQFNVVVPPAAPNGDNAISSTYAGLSTQAGTLLTIQR
jgi:uncharacterized protein (TIGR03437 family)